MGDVTSPSSLKTLEASSGYLGLRGAALIVESIRGGGGMEPRCTNIACDRDPPWDRMLSRQHRDRIELLTPSVMTYPLSYWLKSSRCSSQVAVDVEIAFTISAMGMCIHVRVYIHIMYVPRTPSRRATRVTIQGK